MKTINVALCAYGLSGKIFHQPFIKHHPGFHLQGVLERTKSESTSDNPGITIYRSIDELVGDTQVELVVVNTPNYLHYEHARKAIEAGKHVIVEKPFTSTVAEAEHLIELAQANGVFITVYHNRRYDSDYLTVKGIVTSGVLGQVVDAELRFERYRNTIGPKLFKENVYPGSGFLYDLGSHLADAAVALFGRPKALFADCRKVREGSAVDDSFEIIIYYEQNKRVRLLSGQLVKHPLPAFVLHGTRGSFVMERVDQQEQLLVKGKQPVGNDWAVATPIQTGFLEIETADGTTVANHIPASTGNYMAYYDAVYDTIMSDKPFPITSANIVDVITILEAAQESCAQGCILEL